MELRKYLRPDTPYSVLETRIWARQIWSRGVFFSYHGFQALVRSSRTIDQKLWWPTPPFLSLSFFLFLHFVFLSFHLFIFSSFCLLSFCLLSSCISVYMSFCLFLFLPFLSFWLTFFLSSVFVFLCLSIFIFVHLNLFKIVQIVLKSFNMLQIDGANWLTISISLQYIIGSFTNKMTLVIRRSNTT